MTEPERKFAARVWVDGCYDMVHFGHANLLRQAKLHGKALVVGVHNDAEIALHKGPPVFNETERYRLVKGIKWVDEVVEGAPYETTVATLDKYNCDFCVHGDDITLTADGVDTYAEVKNAGRYVECRRTIGVSTTDLVGRMLLLTKSHHTKDDSIEEHKERARTLSTDNVANAPHTTIRRILPTTQTILDFAEGKPAKPTDKVVYVSGAFDLFHTGHLSFLEECRKLGDYLIVGILSDSVVNSYRGSNHPIMSLHERVLSVLAYKPVSEVLIGAPYEITDDLINQLNVKVVCNGNRVPPIEINGVDPFAAAKRRGIFQLVDSKSNMTTEIIIQRVIDHCQEYMDRNKAKNKKEEAAIKALEMMERKENGGLLTTGIVRIDTSAV